MVKEKRKARLDKGNATPEFIGFSAFESLSIVSNDDDNDAPQHQTSSSSSLLQWAPVYTGSDSHLQQLFPRFNKRDATTKVKALKDLADYFQNADIVKKLKIEALSHWAWLYHSRLFFDDNFRVRAACLPVWDALTVTLPKACKNLLQEYTELCGMLYTTKVDPAAEVRQQAAAVATLFAQESWPWAEGLVSYACRILSYGRASVLYEAVFARGGGSQQQELTDEQKEVNEERFERIVGTALNGLECWMRERRYDDSLQEIFQPKDVYFKTLNSPKASLRRHTYQLVTTALAQNYGHLLSDGFDAKLSHALSAEKEAVNLPTLLETTTVFLKHSSSSTSVFAKPMAKVFKRACYGARVNLWGPILLPLTALYDEPLFLLQALWDGTDATLGPSEECQLVLFIVECTTFALLRRQESTTNQETALAIAQIWLDSLRFALTLLPKQQSGNTLPSYLKDLLDDIAKSFVQLATPRDTISEFQTIRESLFWSKVSFQGSRPSNVAYLIRQLREKETIVELLPIAKAFFLENLRLYQDRSGSVPTEDAYELFSNVFAYCGPGDVLDNKERFVVNDLMRWIIIHTSSLSSQRQSRSLVKFDFELLKQVIENMEQRTKLWGTVVREVVAAKCNLNWFAEGLSLLAFDTDSAWMLCPALDEFLTDVALRKYRYESKEEEKGDEQEESPVLSEQSVNLLRVSLGLKQADTKLLVQPSTLSSWITSECDNPESSPSGPSALMTVLVELVSQKRSILTDAQVDLILFESWRRGGEVFEEVATSILTTDHILVGRFVASGSERLRKELGSFYVMPRLTDNRSAEWSDRAWRLLHVAGLCNVCVGEQVEASLELVGLSDVASWEAHGDVLYGITMSLLKHEDDPVRRLSLLERSNVETSLLLSTILLAVSGASADAALAARVTARSDRCALFLEAVGGKDLDAVLLERTIQHLVQTLTELLQSTQERDVTLSQRVVAVLSQLIERRYEPIVLPTTDELDPSKISEGSKLWYITNPNESTKRELVEVAKVHFDAQAGYYFSVRLDRDGEVQERQTVVDRLRQERDDTAGNGLSLENVTSEERQKREELRNLLCRDVLIPNLLSTPWQTLVGELLSVVVSTVGIGTERGVGSIHYDVLHSVRSVESELQTHILSKDEEGVADTLWKLSLVFGFGLDVPPQASIFSHVPVDPKLSIISLLEFYDEGGEAEGLECAMLAWLSTSLHQAIESDKGSDPKLHEAVSLMFDLAMQISENGEAFCSADLVASRAMYEACRSLAYVESSDAAVTAVGLLIENFVSKWPTDVPQDSGPDWKYSQLGDLLHLARSNTNVRDVVKASLQDAQLVDRLTSALFVQSKRHLALQLLDWTIGEPLFEEQPTPTIARHMDEDEQVDFEIASIWLSRRALVELEKWNDELLEETELVTMGRQLIWLYVLKQVDAVAPKDFSYRPAFCSYLSACGAASAALNVALLNDEAIHEKTLSVIEWPDLLQDEKLLTLPKLSSLVLYQTIETLPSLSRRWWEDSCPKVFLSDVQSFVEHRVGPELFRREIARIKMADFGDMTVKALGRNVTATYEQDDLMLSVTVSVPTAFPFKSAAVDCSKTLGVSQDRLKRWTLQITRMLNNQGGTVQDALLLWKDNVDQEFGGVEPCPVCYSVLHVKTHKLPSLQCKTCQNRFHTDCLSVWFRQSGKSQCVICQQPWQGVRIS